MVRAQRLAREAEGYMSDVRRPFCITPAEREMPFCFSRNLKLLWPVPVTLMMTLSHLCRNNGVTRHSLLTH